MKKAMSILLCTALSATLFTGFGSIQSAAASTDNTDSTAAESTEDYGTVEIQNGDRTITFTEMPKGVLCCNMYATENMLMLGLGDYIVGRNVPASDAEQPLPEIADEFEAIPTVEKSNENAVASGADLLIGQVSSYQDTAWGTYETFEGEDINCYTISGTIAEDETVDNVYEDIEFLGKVFKVEDRAEKLITQIKEGIADVQTAVKDVPENEKVKVFVLDTFKGNEIYTTSKGLESNLIELAGGVNTTRNMADSRWFNTSVETLVDANPDIIIFNDYGTQSMDEKIDFVKSNPALQDIPAVKNEAFIQIPLVAVMQDSRAASACETFAKAFYPDCFKK